MKILQLDILCILPVVTILVVILIMSTTIRETGAFQQVAGPVIINVTPGETKSFSWALVAGDGETSMLKLYADGNGSEFLSFPQSFRLAAGKINYVLGNVTIPPNHPTNTTLNPIIHSTLSENDTESTGGNAVNVELSKLLTITIGVGNTQVTSNLTAIPTTTVQKAPQTGFITKGTINSLITTPATKWIASGNWSMDVFNGNVTLFETKMTWNDINGTDSHSEVFQNFRVSRPILLNQSDSNISLKGLMDVGVNNRVVWKDIPSIIDINGKKAISILVDDNATNRHFASQPILGVVKSFLLCSDNPGPDMKVLVPCSEPNSSTSDSSAFSSGSSSSVQSNLPQQSTSVAENPFEHSQQIQPQNQVSPSNPLQSNAPTNDIDSNLNSISGNFSTFENSTFGLKLQYPSNWNLKQGNTDNPSLEIISVLSPINDDDSSFRIGIHSKEGGITTVNDFANDTVTKYEKEVQGFQTILYNPGSLISGNPAYELEGSYIDNNSTKQHLTETGILFNNKIYIFQFNTADSKSASYLPSVREMVESVQFIPENQKSPELTTEPSSDETPSSGVSAQSCENVSALNATASGFESDPKDYNPPPDAVDGDIGTWWAIQGVPSWLQVELEKTSTICAVEIAWNKGNERIYEFTIATSSDGSNFTEVFSGKSSGKKQSFERYEIDSSPTDVKIIKLSFSGSSSEKGWVSIKEIKVIGS